MLQARPILKAVCAGFWILSFTKYASLFLVTRIELNEIHGCGLEMLEPWNILGVAFVESSISIDCNLGEMALRRMKL